MVSQFPEVVSPYYAAQNSAEDDKKPWIPSDEAELNEDVRDGNFFRRTRR